MLDIEEVTLASRFSHEARLDGRVESVECNCTIRQEAFDEIQVGQDQSVRGILRIESQDRQLVQIRLQRFDLPEGFANGRV
jgi:hypothetical protein